MKTVFLSYSQKDSKIADYLDIMFQTKNIKLIRDIREINYRESIKEFMKRVRKADYSLMIISENYLKSPNCMYEVTEFLKDENYRERIIPLIHTKTNIYTASGRNSYVIYWQSEYQKVHEELKTLHELNKIDTLNELKKIEEIQRKITEFLPVVADMMSKIQFIDEITVEDFNEINAIINPPEANNYQDAESLLNVLKIPDFPGDFMFKKVETEMYFKKREEITYSSSYDILALKETNGMVRTHKWSGNGISRLPLIKSKNNHKVIELYKGDPNKIYVRFDEPLQKNQQTDYILIYKLEDSSKKMLPYLGHYVKDPTEKIILRLVVPNGLINNVTKCIYTDSSAQISLSIPQVINPRYIGDLDLYEWEIYNPSLLYYYRMSWRFD